MCLTRLHSVRHRMMRILSRAIRRRASRLRYLAGGGSCQEDLSALARAWLVQGQHHDKGPLAPPRVRNFQVAVRGAEALVEHYVQVQGPRAKALAPLGPPQRPLLPRPQGVNTTVKRLKITHRVCLRRQLAEILPPGRRAAMTAPAEWLSGRPMTKVLTGSPTSTAFSAARSSSGASGVSASSAALRNAGCSVTYAGALSYSRDTPCTCAPQEPLSYESIGMTDTKPGLGCSHDVYKRGQLVHGYAGCDRRRASMPCCGSRRSAPRRFATRSPCTPRLSQTSCHWMPVAVYQSLSTTVSTDAATGSKNAKGAYSPRLLPRRWPRHGSQSCL